MCDIGEISDTNMDWEEAIGKREGSFAELNGCKYLMTILQQDARLTDFIYKPKSSGYTLQNRSINCAHLPLETGGGGSGHIRWEWGDKDGNKFSGGVSGEIYDDKGNYAKVEVNQDNKGKGSAEVTAGHKEGSKPK